MRWRDHFDSATDGLLHGLVLVSAVSQFWMAGGVSLPAQTSLTGMLVLASLVTAAIPSRWKSRWEFSAACSFGLSVWMLGLPSLWGVADSWLAASGMDVSISVAWQGVWFLLLAMATLFIPSVLVGCRLRAGQELFALGVVLGALGLAPVLGPSGCGLVAAGLGLACFVRTVLTRSVVSGDSLMRSAEKPLSPERSSQVVRNWDLSWFAIVAIGVLWHVGQRAIRQLGPDSFGLMLFEFAILIVGQAWGSRFFANNRRRATALSSVLAVGWIWFCLAMWSVWVRLALWENANVSMVWLLVGLRLSLAAVILLPLALAGGAAMGRRGSRHSFRWALFVLSIAVSGWLLPRIGVVELTMISGGLLLACACLTLNWQSVATQTTALRARSGWSVRTLARSALGVSPVLVLAFALSAPQWVRYQPDLSAKVLFDSNVFLASRTDLPWDQLPLLDDCRLHAVVESDRGTLTAWKARGSQILIRENGIPKGTLSQNPDSAPRYIPDVLPVLLPMVLHEQPDNVLLMGVRSGESLAVSLSFPARHILVVEADAGVMNLCRTLQPELLRDERLEVRVCDPTLAVRSLRESFDVIIDGAAQPALPTAASGLTVESLRAAASLLNEHGVFVFRFQHVDLGTAALSTLAKTMQAGFQHVAAVEMTPGEMLFLGTNSNQGFVRAGFLGRWKRPHVRKMLATMGWDWATPLHLPMQNGEAIQTLAARSGAVVNVTSGSTWPFWTPIEVMRWEPKLQRVSQELAKHERFLMGWGGDDANDPEVATRLSEWELSRQIIRRHTDEFWAYRKSVKDHMTKSPRSMIQPVSATQTDSGLHPEDDRRLRYFRTIGDIAKKSNPTASDLDRLQRFESPFDPLVSPFLHQELVELASRCQTSDPQRELHHRLAGIYFSTSGDRSIRNVADALQFVNSQPDAVPSPAERFDQLNGLLQMLLNRWMARGEFRPTSSRVMLNDIERSIAATETSFAVMDKLVAEGTVPSIRWDARKQLLERQLVRPLRTYRTQVMQHYLKSERTREAAATTTDAAP